ncbi:MAG: sodium:solute symporter [Bacteroidales bacterium]|nr:sodium:solute symporter [Bacteroidales bacterium]
MHLLDWIALGLFGLGLIGIIVWVLRQKEESTEDYFLAGKKAGWISIGSSIFASNIGSEHLVGLAGAGFVSGMAMAHWEMHAWLILVLGWVFVPFYDRIKIFTMPEFLEKRFSSSSRTILSVISLVSYILTKVAVTVYAGGVVFKEVFNIEYIVYGSNGWGTVTQTVAGGWEKGGTLAAELANYSMHIDFFWIAAIGLVVITGLYTVFGGMKAVLYTSVLQTPILLFGSIVILVMGLIEVGGWGEVKNIVGPNLELVRSAKDPEFPWTGVLFASAIIGFWYWCTDQFIVQRVLSGKNRAVARRGTILAGYLKLLPVFIFLVPGMIAFALSQKNLLVVNDSDGAFAAMVSQLLPDGVTGIVVAGLLAALMSSLASLFNSSAMLFVEDFYRKFRPNFKEKHYVIVGRIATGVIVILGVIWIPVMMGLGDVLYEYLQGVQGLLAPAIAAVFLLGVFWKRTTQKGALWGMIVGFGIGMFRLILNVIYSAKASFVSSLERVRQQISVATEHNASFLLRDAKSVLQPDDLSKIVDNAEPVTNTLNALPTSFFDPVYAEPAMQISPEAIDTTMQLSAHADPVMADSLSQVAASADVAPTVVDSVLNKGALQHAASVIGDLKEQTQSLFEANHGILYRIAAINWLHFTEILFAISVATIVIVSLFTKKPTDVQLQYTYGAADAADKKYTRSGITVWDVINTIIIIGIVLAFYFMFW